MKGFSFSPYTKQILAKATAFAAKEQCTSVSVYHLLYYLFKMYKTRIPIGKIKEWQTTLSKALHKLEKTNRPNDILEYDEILKKTFSVANDLRAKNREQLIQPKHLWEALLEGSRAIINMEKLAEELEKEPVQSSAEETTATEAEEEASLLKRICINFTEKARLGGLEPVIGRKEEIRRVIQVLLKRKKNNPLLLGEAGVGKTAIIEGIAQQLVEAEDIPVLRSLKNKEILGLDLMSLIGGTGIRGELEKRLNQLIKELEENSDRYLLFIDEVHNLIGAGKAEGSADLANYLKPALARGEISIIGATTFAEYKRFIEPDAALKRRFEPMFIAEPTLEQTITILENIKTIDEEFHNVKYDDDVIQNIPKWASNYFGETHRPDNAINLMDNLGSFTAQKFEDQEEPPAVTAEIAAEFIQKAKGVEPEYILMGSNQRIANLKKELVPYFRGQDKALDKLFQSLAPLGLQGYPRKPVMPLMFIGSPDSEKLNTAHLVAEYLYPEANKVYTLDLAAYTERESLYSLIGPPRGIEGFQDGGELTEFVKRNPQCCFIIYNAEHCHANVLRIFIEPLRKGTITDSARISYPFHQAMMILLVDSPDRLKARHGDEFMQLVPNKMTFTETAPEMRMTFLKDAVDKFSETFANMGYKLAIEEKVYEWMDKIIRDQAQLKTSSRMIQDMIKSHIEDPLAAHIIENAVEPKKIEIKIEEEKIIFM